MFQTIKGHYVYVIDLDDVPVQRINDGGDPALTPYAEALNQALDKGLIDKPGKYAIEVLPTGEWNVAAVLEAVE